MVSICQSQWTPPCSCQSCLPGSTSLVVLTTPMHLAPCIGFSTTQVKFVVSLRLLTVTSKPLTHLHPHTLHRCTNCTISYKLHTCTNCTIVLSWYTIMECSRTLHSHNGHNHDFHIKYRLTLNSNANYL